MNSEEHLSEITDTASRAEMIDRDARVAAARAVTPVPKDWDKKHCYNEDCGEPLPKERIAAGRFLCVTCKTLEEKKGK